MKHKLWKTNKILKNCTSVWTCDQIFLPVCYTLTLGPEHFSLLPVLIFKSEYFFFQAYMHLVYFCGRKGFTIYYRLFKEPVTSKEKFRSWLYAGMEQKMIFLNIIEITLCEQVSINLKFYKANSKWELLLTYFEQQLLATCLLDIKTPSKQHLFFPRD